MKTFAERLRYYMELTGTKQVDLVEKTKINKSSISEYLSGNYEPKQRNIYKIAMALGIKPSQLMGIAEEPAAPAEHQGLTLGSQEKDLIIKFRKLDDDGRARILRQVEFELFQMAIDSEKEEVKSG